MKECLGIFLICVAISAATLFVSLPLKVLMDHGDDLAWQAKLGIFLGLTVFVGLIVTGAYLISGVGV